VLHNRRCTHLAVDQIAANRIEQISRQGVRQAAVYSDCLRAYSVAEMCEKCDEIEKTIERYRRIQQRIQDQQLIDGAQQLIDEMEADKAALHPDV
jgi:hypothetical protein